MWRMWSTKPANTTVPRWDCEEWSRSLTFYQTQKIACTLQPPYSLDASVEISVSLVFLGLLVDALVRALLHQNNVVLQELSMT